MKKILFFITAIIFITGCGSSSPSSSSLSPLSPKEATTSNVIVFRNINSAKLALVKKEIYEDFKNANTPPKEFLYSSSVTCKSLGFQGASLDTPSSGQDPSEKLYLIPSSSSDCLELDHAKTKDAGTQGFVVIIPLLGGSNNNISIN